MDSQNKQKIRKNLAEKLKNLADKKGKTTTDLIHLILENYVDSNYELIK